ncbi:MAG: hypothetical protein BGN88_07585 [Clostridiales bacterium 43-6]|nr:MAG: hypothetical protein BGN88_07585 [Clostridiales bacterium 43-6]
MELYQTNIKNTIHISTLLDKDGQQAFEELREEIFKLHDLETDKVYIQGYKDCIKLLKILNIL